MSSVVKLLMRLGLINSILAAIRWDSGRSWNRIVGMLKIRARKCRIGISKKLVSLAERVFRFVVLIRKSILNELNASFANIVFWLCLAGIQCASLWNVRREAPLPFLFNQLILFLLKLNLLRYELFSLRGEKYSRWVLLLLVQDSLITALELVFSYILSRQERGRVAVYIFREPSRHLFAQLLAPFILFHIS